MWLLVEPWLTPYGPTADERCNTIPASRQTNLLMSNVKFKILQLRFAKFHFQSKHLINIDYFYMLDNFSISNWIHPKPFWEVISNVSIGYHLFKMMKIIGIKNSDGINFWDFFPCNFAQLYHISPWRMERSKLCSLERQLYVCTNAAHTN